MLVFDCDHKGEEAFNGARTAVVFDGLKEQVSDIKELHLLALLDSGPPAAGGAVSGGRGTFHEAETALEVVFVDSVIGFKAENVATQIITIVLGRRV